MNSALRRRDFLLRSAALAGASLLGPRAVALAQEASPEAEPEEVTVGAPVEGKINVTWWSHNGPAFVDANTQMIEKFMAANPDVN
ncbi:MAG: hypothetical protein KC442_14470, partial [Thermomicrobiales bacterium]|nr:hypothetical protein [Thermomicrobiales bacterium]